MLQSPIYADIIDPDDLVAVRARVVDETKGGFRRFCRSLTPDYGKAWRDIWMGYVGLVLVVAATAAIGSIGIGSIGILGGLIAAVIGAAAIGYGIAYLQLFIHEAAHANLAADRAANDRIADWLICWQVGTNIAAYRRTHSEHHRNLGRHGDTEISYTHAPTFRFIVEMMTGVHAVRVFLSRSKEPKPERTDSKPGLPWPLIRGAAIHLAILGSLAIAGAWPAILAWCGGMAVFYPLFATIRQLIEHRPLAHETAQSQLGRGAVTRMFGRGPIASTFGAAGFNRHLLHHIEPQVSYTRFDALEAYLMETSAAEAIDARRASYAGTFVALIAEARRG